MNEDGHNGKMVEYDRIENEIDNISLMARAILFLDSGGTDGADCRGEIVPEAVSELRNCVL